MVFGGLSILLYGGPSFMFSAEGALRKVDLQSAFFALVFVIVLLVLAYLTNPSENSFRTYLTEQSFRQHLSRLEDSNQEDQSDSDDSGVHFSLTRRIAKSPQKHVDNFPAQPFHFVNRAAVSLRTPKHVFYSFGIMTIAAVLPTGATNRSGASQPDGFMVSESWFIGAFGKWWRGGPIQAWWVENAANSKDTERCNSGVLDMKPLDALECYDVGQLPINRESPSKPRVSERSLQRATNNAPRSTTPPPLPKSASLPLHVTRTPHDKQHGMRQIVSQQAIASLSPEPARVNPPALLPSPSTIFDQSPVISDILRQITSSKSAVHDLRNQLKDFRAAAAESHAHIQSDLDVHRERKRSEDAARAELKARTKTLEDSKRTAEASKREAEKRLRAAESARDTASERVQRLDQEIGALKVRMNDDKEAIICSKQDGDDMDKEMAEQLERKRKEIKVAEEVIAALNSRAKELEEKIASEEERLRYAKEQADMKKQDRAFNPLHVVSEPVEAPLWAPIVPEVQEAMPDPHFDIHTDRAQQIEVFPDLLPSSDQTPVRRSSIPEAPVQLATSPRPRRLSLGSLSNFRDHPVPARADSEIPTLPTDDVPPPLTSGRTQSTKFSPFSDQEIDVSTDMHEDIAISPRSTSLIPTSLIKTLDRGGVIDDLSRSFQSESDTFLDRDWRKLHPFPAHPVENTAVFSSSPTSLNFPSFDAVEQEDPFEIRPPPLPLRHRITSDGLETERVYLTSELAGEKIGQPLARARSHEMDEKTVAPRRWFSSSKHDDKKGLNPEAKAFHLKNFPLFGASKPASIDSIISHGSTASSTSLPTFLAPPSTGSDSILSTLSMRAFAPSPEEREALTRAMGSSNTSLERLPALSNMIGSIPPTTNNTHITAQHAPQPLLPDTTHSIPLGLSWFHALRRPKFSPWEDEAGNNHAAR